MSEIETASQPYQSLLIVSFGGPEGPDDVIPFLRNVLRGKNVPEARLHEVAEHYQHFGGVSPINDQVRSLIEALRKDFESHDIHLPIYWGNRNWHPLLPDTIRQMQNDGIKRSLAFFTSAYSCYSGCRQYRENIADARQQVGVDAPQIDKLRMFFNHPKYLEAIADRLQEAQASVSADRLSDSRLVFTAHSIPIAMAERSQYVQQLTESCRLAANSVGKADWDLVYQSRSGPPSQPWLEPDICDHLETLAGRGVRDVILMPIGFLSDHMEVMFDLDTEAQEVAKKLGLRLVRAATVGTHPAFIAMIRELVLERIQGAPRRAVGQLPASHDFCPKDCCLSGRS